MTKTAAASLLIRVMLLYAVLRLAPSLLHAVGLLGAMHGAGSPGRAALLMAATIAAPAIWIGSCLVALRFSDRIAALVVRDDGDCGSLVSLSFAECQTLGYNFIGVLLIVEALPQLFRILGSAIFLGQAGSGMPYLRTSLLPSLLPFLAQLALGVFLFARPKRLVSLWERLLRQDEGPT